MLAAIIVALAALSGVAAPTGMSGGGSGRAAERERQRNTRKESSAKLNVQAKTPEERKKLMEERKEERSR